MKIISQQGKEAYVAGFGIRRSGEKWAVTGRIAGEPFAPTCAYALGVYKDRASAVAVMAMVAQHKGRGPFVLPPEDAVIRSGFCLGIKSLLSITASTSGKWKPISAA